MSRKQPKPSPTQLEALRMMAAHGCRLTRWKGGYWTYPFCNVKCVIQEPDGDYRIPAWHVGTVTIHAMDRHGWIERCALPPGDTRDGHLADRLLTDAGARLAETGQG